jgi:carboxyl-terminal processing protease
LPGIPEWEKLVKYAQKDTINLSKLPQGARDLILERFKALVSRHIWRDQGYYMVLNSGDGIVQKGLGEVK